MHAEDFSAEDDKEAQELFASAALSEFQRKVLQLKREARKDRLLYLRSLSRAERKAIRAKYKLNKV